jgi:hypothetical protein
MLAINSLLLFATFLASHYIRSKAIFVQSRRLSLRSYIQNLGARARADRGLEATFDDEEDGVIYQSKDEQDAKDEAVQTMEFYTATTMKSQKRFLVIYSLLKLYKELHGNLIIPSK